MQDKKEEKTQGAGGERRTGAERVHSMTAGSPIRLMLGFMLPLLLGNVFQQAYNMVDGMIVGRMLGADALAAVGATTSVQFLTLGLCMGCCAGFAIPISQRFGAGDRDGMHGYEFHAIVLSAGLALIMTTVCALLCGRIMVIMQMPANILRDAYQYLLIIFLGIPFTILYNMSAGILRAVGNSRAPFLFLAISTFLNIFLDIFCIAVLHWGCAGAAIATIASQALSGLFCVLYIRRKVPQLLLSREDVRWNRRFAGTLIAMGVPMGIQYSITAIGSMVMQSANNSLGSVYVSGFTAGTKLKQLFICPYDAMATALATYVSQNYGARQWKRVRQGVYQMLAVSVSYGVLAGLMMIVWGRDLSGLFLSGDHVEALDAAARYLRCMGWLFWVLGPLNIYRNAMQALGAAARSVLSGAIEMVARSSVALAFVPVYGYNAICWTDQTAWIAATIYLFLMGSYVIRTRCRVEQVR